MSATIFRGHISGKMISAAVAALRKGELIIYPTDTIYGIGCDMSNQKAINKLNKLKQRPNHKPFSFICEGISEVAKFAKVSNTAHRLMKQVLPGPYTFILPMNRELPKRMVNSDHAVGIRIPNHQITQEIVRQLGGAITTTSVNVSTQEPVCSLDDLDPEFLKSVSVIIDAGEIENEPSTIIDFTSGSPSILREGKGLEELLTHINFDG